MAATAYAFVVSLMNTMDQIQIHPRFSTCFDHHQFEPLRKNLDSLLDFVENHSDMDAGSSEAEDLLSRIATVAQLAEDLIEKEAADQIRDLSTSEKTESFLLNLQKKIQEMDCIMEAVILVKEKRPFQDDQLQLYPNASMSPPTAKTSSMVGFDGYVEQLLDELTGHHSGRRILPIVGMGGVGKTTLATSVYHNLLTVEHFTVRVWVTVSLTFNVRDIFLQALSCLGESTSDSDKRKTDDDELGEKLHKNLYGRRYLVVLDDMWSVEAWERMKFYLPENNNRSRIVVTTRQQQLVNYFASSSLAVDLLDDKNSWELFCDKVFGHHEQGGFPPELQQAGEKIVRRCRGLPLAISVIGGLLAKSPRTQEYWEKIAKDKSLDLEYSGEINKPLSILYPSYKHLPVYLKSCFLHLGLFPEDHQIDVSHLIKFWVAEGFIKRRNTTNQSLEEIAESYIKELVDRNLLLVVNLRVNKKFETCSIHDFVRELSIRIAEKENFYCVQRDIAGKYDCVVDERTARFYLGESSPSTAKSPSLYDPLRFYSRRAVPFKCRLLRVMVIPPIRRGCEEVNLRMVIHPRVRPISPRPDLPSSISLFWSLQTIIIRENDSNKPVPSGIWKMPQLRHIEIPFLQLPEPTPPTDDDDDVIVLQNLQTLKRVKNLSLREEVYKRIPNIKEVEIHYVLYKQDGASFDLHNIACLSKLESLRYSCQAKGNVGCRLQNLKLPDSLKELSLGNCRLTWSDLEMIGSLPHLQILVLKEDAVVGAEWDLGVGGFISLKHLQIEGLNEMTNWIADASNFPVLETLRLQRLSQLDEIPEGIGEIPTLERIQVTDCSKSAAMSAVKILEEQESNGNEALQLQINLSSRDEAERWKEEIQEMGVACKNLRISGRIIGTI